MFVYKSQLYNRLKSFQILSCINHKVSCCAQTCIFPAASPFYPSGLASQDGEAARETQLIWYIKSTKSLPHNSFRKPKSRKLRQRALCTNLYYIENLSKGFKRDRISSTMEWPMMENEVLSVIFALNVLPILVSFTVIDHFI